MGIRMQGPIPGGFFGFQRSPDVSASARALLVLAAGQHNAALAVDGGHPGSGTPNWEMTQWQGLVASCVTFPELRGCAALVGLALEELEALLVGGVYADGVETEMASGYDMGTAGDFFNTLRLLRLAGLPPPPPSFSARVEAMWNYGAFVADAAGCLPRNGDSDLCGNGFSEEVADYFGRPDWRFARSNGASGTPPAPVNGSFSSVFPWAGQVVLRSGFEKDATWVWFDVGPYGSSGHAHRDKLTLNLHARGAMLLVDSGRFAYQGKDLSAQLHVEYGRNTSAHNTLTIDGCDQLPLPPLASEPIPAASVVFAPAFDAAYGAMSAFNGLAGAATHTRGVHYQRRAAGAAEGDWVAVVDRVGGGGGRRRAVQATWHAHPNASTVAVDAGAGFALVGGAVGATGAPSAAQVCVVAARGGAAAQWGAAAVVRGRRQGGGATWQGWFSATYDDAWEASVAVFDAEGVADGAVFAWLLVPSAGAAPCSGHAASVLEVAAEAVRLAVSVNGVATNITVALGA